MIQLIINIVLGSYLLLSMVSYFRDKRKKRRELLAKHPIRKLQDVVKGESIMVSFSSGNFSSGNFMVDVIHNNIVDKKIHLKIYYQRGNGPIMEQNSVYGYRDPIFKDFSTLNPVSKASKSASQNTDEFLEQRLKTLLERENYEQASVIRDAIEKIRTIEHKHKHKQ